MIVKQIWQCLFLHLADGIHFPAIMSVRLPDTLYLLPDSPPEIVPHPVLQNNARARSPDNAYTLSDHMQILIHFLYFLMPYANSNTFFILSQTICKT